MLAPGRSQRRVGAPGLQGQRPFMPGGERKIMGTPLGGHLRHASGDGEGEWPSVARRSSVGWKCEWLAD